MKDLGFGERGSRAGWAARCGWAAAHSLLPPENDPRNCDCMAFATHIQPACETPADGIDFSADFTIKFQIQPGASVLNAASRGADGNGHGLQSGGRHRRGRRWNAR